MNIRNYLSIIIILFITTLLINPIFVNADDWRPYYLIKTNNSAAIYYLGVDGKRYVFPDEQTYFSWYRDFSEVEIISEEELSSHPLAANVTIRPGTKLIKIQTDPTVYAVEPGGTLKSIVSEENAASLWGADWATKVVDVPDSFFTNYTVCDPLTDGEYPAGTLVKAAASPNVYYYDGTDYRIFASEAAFKGNRFSWDNIQTVPDTITITAGGDTIAGEEGDITDTSGGCCPGCY